MFKRFFKNWLIAKHLCLSLTLVLVLFGCDFKNRGPVGTMMPLINGDIDDEEWSRARRTNIQSKFELYCKQDDHYFFVGIRNRTESPFYVDLFVSMKDSLYNIHASSQLGERILKGENWDDSTPITNWGYTNHWSANTVLFDRIKFKKLREEGFEGNVSLDAVIPYDRFEFQFAKKYWPFEGARVRIEMRNMVGLKDYEETIFPRDSERKDDSGWFVLKF